jgi:hypothetical protein
MEEKFDDVLGKDECLLCQDVEPGMETGSSEYVKELPDNHAERIDITEADKDIIEKWFVYAKEIDNHDELVDFLKALMTKYNHDYGTVIHAMTAGAIATIHVMNEDKYQGGITGFQASCMMWEFMKRFNHIDGPARLLQFDKMLYPQYEHDFEKIISKESWEWLQEKAKENLFCRDGAHPAVAAHWQTIVDGVVPFGYKIKEDE